VLYSFTSHPRSRQGYPRPGGKHADAAGRLPRLFRPDRARRRRRRARTRRGRALGHALAGVRSQGAQLRSRRHQRAQVGVPSVVADVGPRIEELAATAVQFVGTERYIGRLAWNLDAINVNSIEAEWGLFVEEKFLRIGLLGTVFWLSMQTEARRHQRAQGGVPSLLLGTRGDRRLFWLCDEKGQPLPRGTAFQLSSTACQPTATSVLVS
jgi:hypothetical protein